MKLEAVGYSEDLIPTYQTIWRHSPEHFSLSHILNDRALCVVYTEAQVCGPVYFIRIIIVCATNELSLDGEWRSNCV